MATKRGAVDHAQTEKAGCGIRFNPEQLGDDTGFDFSQAAEQLNQESPEHKPASDQTLSITMKSAKEN